MKTAQIIELINKYWKFDNDQAHVSTWHDKNDLIAEIESANVIQIAHRVSSDGVFFACSECDSIPGVVHNQYDLLTMKYCPNCGSKFVSAKAQ